MTRNRATHRLAGLAGFAGALLFFCGDMLFYGHFGAGATFHEGMQHVVREASLGRLFTGGLSRSARGLLVHHRLLACGPEYCATQSYARPHYFLYPCSHDGRRERSSRAMGAARPRNKV